VHALLLQVGVAWPTVVVHWFPHMLQLFGSAVVSTHVEPQSVGVGAEHPDEHAYVLPDPAQLGVPPLHVTPHPPQLLVVFTAVSQPCEGGPLQCA
jgi:hypothetical protein